MLKRIKFSKFINIIKRNCERMSLHKIAKDNSFKNEKDFSKFITSLIY